MVDWKKARGLRVCGVDDSGCIGGCRMIDRLADNHSLDTECGFMLSVHVHQVPVTRDQVGDLPAKR